MSNRRNFGFIVFLAAAFSGFCSQVPPEIESGNDIIAQNIAGVGGSERLAGVQGFAFSYGPTTYFMSEEGPMKMTVGKAPIITEVILVNQEGVRRNCFNNVSHLEGDDAAMYRVLAKLRSGLFTLRGFEGELAYQELRRFGPQEMHYLTTSEGDLQVEFFVDAGTHLLKRLVMKGFNEAQGGNYEVNHDFGPYQEVDGLKLPSSWFSSRVGTRGSEFEIQDVRLNPDLDPDFFTSLDVNVGEIEINPGELKGNLVEFAFQRGRLQLGTNWTNRCIEGAGFKPNDTLVLAIQDREIEVEFFNAQPPREAMGAGSHVMMPNFRSENYNIYLMSEEYQDLAEALEPLMPIRLTKK